jgi:hypothetical protein
MSSRTADMIALLVEETIDHVSKETGMDVPFEMDARTGGFYHVGLEGFTVRVEPCNFASANSGVDLETLDARGNSIAKVRVLNTGAEMEFTVGLAADVLARMIDSVTS